MPLEIVERDLFCTQGVRCTIFTSGSVGFTRDRVGSDVPDAWVIHILIHVATW